MSAIEKMAYLEKEISRNINKMKKKADKNKRRASIVSISSAVLGALVTVALGLQIESIEEVLKNIALVSGALISVVNAFESFFGYRSLWLKQKATLLNLYSLSNEIEFFKTGLEDSSDIDENVVSNYFQRYQDIWDVASEEWLRLRREQIQSESQQ